MQFPLASSPAQTRQTRERFAKPEDYLSYELGKAVQELPPLYTRLLAGSISLLIFGAIAWAHFSKVDEVAVANGELIASAQVRPVRAIGDGMIREIKVKEGELVEKGDILIERDPSLPQTDVDRLAKSAELIQEDLMRLEAERMGATKAGTALQDELLESRIKDFESHQASALAEANRQVSVLNEAKVSLSQLQENLVNAKTSAVNAEAYLANTKSIIPKVETNLALAQEREQSLKSLLNSGAAPKLQYIEAQEKVVRSQTELTKAQSEVTNANDKVTQARDRVMSLEKEIAAQAQKIRQAEEAYRAAQNDAARVASERESEILTELKKRREEQTTVEGQLEQAKKERQKETIEAPFSGTIYNVKATKGPVQAGEELLSIVPKEEELLLEVKVLNRDIGFIREGMKAKVKMATFPFQEFGTVDAEVIQVSPNAITDKDLGLVFLTRVRLNQRSMKVRGQTVEFTPGMAATAEIVSRRKSILTFLVEPITRRFSEAFSVR